VLCALYVAVAWKRGARRPRRARLAAPALGRGLLIFVWALGFRSVCSALRWNDPQGPFQIFSLLPSLPLTLGITALLIGTRTQPDDTPIRALLRCPRSGRLWWGTGTLALAATGCLIGFDSLLWHASGYLHLQSNWSDSVRERFLYGSPIEATLSRLSAVVLAPFAEELAYRGVLFGTLATRTSAHRAALISALLFAASHGYGWYGFCTVAFSGYLWARMAARTGSLLPGMLSHSAFNLVLTVAALAGRG
jgi:membrane protease YdiL (CAAX protease family)